MQSFLPNSFLALPVLRLYGWHGDSLVKPAQVSSDSQGRQFQQEAVQDVRKLILRSLGAMFSLTYRTGQNCCLFLNFPISFSQLLGMNINRSFLSIAPKWIL